MKVKGNEKMKEMRKNIKLTLFGTPQQQSSPPNIIINKRSNSVNQQINAAHSIEHKRIGQSICQCQKQKFEDLYKLGTTIGQGAHGIVKICFKQQTQYKLSNYGHIPTKYAVKKIMSANDPELINTIIQTFNINRSLNDVQNIIKAYDLFIDENQESAYWVMEYCEQKSLQNFMKQQLSDKLIKTIMRQLAQSLQQIHKRGVCHRDIKPDNILIKLFGTCQVKLIDFGVSKYFFIKSKSGRNLHEMWTRTGTVLYQAPEIFIGGGYDEKIDVWAAGVILYQLLTGKYPYYCGSILDTIEAITDPAYTIDLNKEFQQLNYLQQDLLKRLLQKDPEKRLTAGEFLLHPWLIEQAHHSPHKAKDDILMQKLEIDHNEEYKLASSMHLQEIGFLSQSSPMYLNPLIGGSKHYLSNHIYHIHKGEDADLKIDEILLPQKAMARSSSFELASRKSLEEIYISRQQLKSIDDEIDQQINLKLEEFSLE